MRGAIHVVTIGHMEAQLPDAEGRGGEHLARTTKAKGRVVYKLGSETPEGLLGRFAENIDAVFIAPLGTEIEASDIITAKGVDPTADGTYEVSYVLYLVNHLEAHMRVRGVEIPSQARY